MKDNLDDLDLAIVHLLKEDGRISSAEMARRLGHVSARTVNNRIDRLVSKGIIKVVAVWRPKTVGYSIAADMTIEVEPERVREVAEAIARLDKVYYVGIGVGDRDVTVSVYAVDIQDLQGIIDEAVKVIRGIRSIRTFIVSEVIKESWDWRAPLELP